MRPVEVQLRHARVLGLRYACPAERNHAFYEAMSFILKSRHDLAELRMSSYYRRWRPETAADVFDLGDEHALADYPPGAAVPPWVDATPGAFLREREAEVLAEPARRSMPDWGVMDGHDLFGPMSGRGIRFLVARMAEAIGGVRALSKPSDARLLCGALLADDRDGLYAGQVFDVRVGALAAAALAVMGQEATGAWVSGEVIRRSGVMEWPGVQSGLFTKEDALCIFDDHFRGRPRIHE